MARPLILLFSVLILTPESSESSHSRNSRLEWSFAPLGNPITRLDAKHRYRRDVSDLSWIGLTNEQNVINDTSIARDFNISNPVNLTVVDDHHTYYNSSLVLEPEKMASLWVNLDAFNAPVKTHEMLSQSYRRAATVTLSFDFSFYGHFIRNITIATGGFLYMGDYMHSWLASTQYIAPLMANFDTTISSHSVVKYADNGTHFVTQWEDVRLQDMKDAGNFTFQVVLKKSGDITFAYKSIPIPVTNIPDDEHPVKIGLSDAYIIDRLYLFFRRKIIYEYHRVEIKKEAISSNTGVYLKALPSCVSFQDCRSCVEAPEHLACEWCHRASRCSDGMDRHRQSWMMQGCEQHKENVCSKTATTNDVSSPQVQPIGVLTRGSSQFGTAGVVSIIFVLIALVVIAGWIFYAYRNPHTSSGQLIIKYRPSQWRLQKGEPQYTPASVHI